VDTYGCNTVRPSGRKSFNLVQACSNCIVKAQLRTCVGAQCTLRCSAGPGSLCTNLTALAQRPCKGKRTAAGPTSGMCTSREDEKMQLHWQQTIVNKLAAQYSHPSTVPPGKVLHRKVGPTMTTLTVVTQASPVSDASLDYQLGHKGPQAIVACRRAPQSYLANCYG